MNGFKLAQQLFNTSNTLKNETWVLIMAEDREINMGDQKMIEKELFEKGLKSMRCSFLTVMKHGKVSSEGVLSVHGKDICIVYFRTGYSDFQYHDEKGDWCELKWKAREMIECSNAIKCPSIHG